jgi:hypothetical protein
MTHAQLTGRHVRMRRSLAATLDSLPWNVGRLDRLTRNVTRAERGISAGRAQEKCDTPALAPERCAQSSHEWLGTFAARLIQLRPAMSADAAMRYAVMSIRHAMDLDPTHAAELLVAVEPSDTPVMPRSSGDQREPPSARYEAMFAGRAHADR